MSETTIEWTVTRLKDGRILPGFTFNPWTGCSKVSPACQNCYAQRQANRFGVKWGAGQERRPASEKYWTHPIDWNKKAERLGYRLKVFCASMADIFDEEAPEGARDRLWALIKKTPNLDWLLLTKRPENIAKMLPPDWGRGYFNVALGVTAENQKAFDDRVAELRKIPCAIRFISSEPLLGPISFDLGPFDKPEAAIDGIHWVIAGGESGPGARPTHPNWVRGIRDQCKAAGVLFHMKQWGSLVTEDQAPNEIVLPGESTRFFAKKRNKSDNDFTAGDQTDFYRVDKKAAGRLLDGVEHNAAPSINGGLV